LYTTMSRMTKRILLIPKPIRSIYPDQMQEALTSLRLRNSLYVIEGDKCNLLDIRSGELIKAFTTGNTDTKELGYIGVYEDLLILGSNFSEYSGMEKRFHANKKPQIHGL